MSTYVCPNPDCDYKMTIGLEISVGGESKHKCPKCGEELKQED